MALAKAVASASPWDLTTVPCRPTSVAPLYWRGSTRLRNARSTGMASTADALVSQLRASLANTERLLAEARGLAYEVQRLDQEFSRLYPNEYTADVSSQRLAEEAQERWQQGLDGLHTALRVQAQVTQNLAEDESALAALVQQSQSAGGALQAAQATNQLLALQAKQSIQAQQLQITQNRAVALELARQSAAAEEARERRRRFMGNGTPYTPYPVQFYR